MMFAQRSSASPAAPDSQPDARRAGAFAACVPHRAERELRPEEATLGERMDWRNRLLVRTRRGAAPWPPILGVSTMRGNIPSKKKPAFPVGPPLLGYLKKYNRAAELPVRYEDLLRHDCQRPPAQRAQPGHAVGDGPPRAFGAAGPLPGADVHLFAAQGGRGSRHPEPPHRRPHRLLHLRQHEAFPRPDHQPAQRQLRPLLRQACRRLARLRAGAGRAALAEHGDVPRPRRDAGRGAHHRHPRRRLHARSPRRARCSTTSASPRNS